MFISNFAHELHLSMCNITFNEAKNRLEIQQRIFYDDLEKTLQIQLGDEKFDILSPEVSPLNYDSLFHEYIQARVNVEIDDVKIKIDFLEYEVDQDAIVFYLFKENITSVNNLEFHSSILFELFQDQTNIFSFRKGDVRKSGRLTVNSDPISFIF